MEREKKYFFAVETNVRNEDNYLLEFIAYYLVQGADHIFIYDNESQIPVNKIIEPFKEFCTVIPFPGQGVKPLILNHWLRNGAKDCEWVATVDCDEFIQPLADKTIRDFILRHSTDADAKVGAIAVNWVFFGDNNLTERLKPGDLAIEKFSKRQMGVNHHIKTIYRPQFCTEHMGAHHVNLHSGKYVDALGQLHRGGALNNATKPAQEVIRVNHYWWRTAPEWKTKINSIRDDNGDSRGGDLNFWIKWMETNDCNAVEDNSCYRDFGQLVRDKLSSMNIDEGYVARVVEKYNSENRKYVSLTLTKSPIIDLLYDESVYNPSNIYEHIPILYEYAKKCSSIVELGTRNKTTTLAFVRGLRDRHQEHDEKDLIIGKATRATKVKTLICNDSNFPLGSQISDYNLIRKCCKEENINYQFIVANNIEIQLPQVDLLFINTWHVYGQMKRELEKHHKNVAKYIIRHNTTIDELLGETVRLKMDSKQQAIDSGFPIEEINCGLGRAIDEFLLTHGDEWEMYVRLENNNGLTILKRKN